MNEKALNCMENNTPDIQLIRGYLNGNAESFDILYERYRKPLYAYLNRLLRGQTLNADDLFQKTWLRAIDNLSRYSDREMFLAWLMRIAHNLSVDHFRSTTRKGEFSMDEAPVETLEMSAGSDEAPSKKLEQTELAAAIDSAVAELPPDQKEVFLLRQEDISFREIAEIQKCSINTCLARMKYALNNLQKKLKEWTAEER